MTKPQSHVIMHSGHNVWCLGCTCLGASSWRNWLTNKLWDHMINSLQLLNHCFLGWCSSQECPIISRLTWGVALARHLPSVTWPSHEQNVDANSISVAHGADYHKKGQQPQHLQLVGSSSITLERNATARKVTHRLCTKWLVGISTPPISSWTPPKFSVKQHSHFH